MHGVMGIARNERLGSIQTALLSAVLRLREEPGGAKRVRIKERATVQAMTGTSVRKQTNGRELFPCSGDDWFCGFGRRGMRWLDRECCQTGNRGLEWWGAVGCGTKAAETIPDSVQELDNVSYWSDIM